ncbi:MAG: nuclear transport factor 2 family protein [Anaerolineae bacterium]|nr:nuclear transport factor 2 family protein [Anaerolineae bacterium]
MCPTRMAKLESAIRIALAFNEAFNRHDIAGMMQLVGEDCIFEAAAPAPDGALYSGKEAISRYWQDFFRRTPHALIKVEEIFGFGNRCIMRWRYEGEDAAGLKGRVRGVDIIKEKDGAISERLSYLKG